MKETDSYRDTLKRIGFVLIAIGLLDICWMVYCITHQISYSSSVNIFAVIAGIFLLKGNLNAAKAVRFFVILLYTGCVGALFVILPFNLPIDLLSVEIHLAQWQGVIPLLIFAVILPAGAWIILEFRRPALAKAMDEAGGKPWKPRNAALIGAALVLFLGAMLHFMLHGEAADEAIARATKLDGPSFKYVVSSMNISNDHVWATVTAYNDHEIRTEHVEFDE